MVRPDRDRLSGEVEVDETYLGSEEPGVTGRMVIDRQIVVVAVEMNGGPFVLNTLLTGDKRRRSTGRNGTNFPRRTGPECRDCPILTSE
jgi:hypothetical protein